MATLFKRALGLFVEFNDDETKAAAPTFAQPTQQGGGSGLPQNIQFSNEQIEKFEAHFSDLMDKANLPGPDYYEYCKMMETLESHLPDEKTRMNAVFATLSVQGLTKEKLISTANTYKQVIETDHQNFQGALNDKTQSDVDDRKNKCLDLEEQMKKSSAQIQTLTQHIADCQAEIAKLQKEITEGEDKISQNQKGYLAAYQVMLSKIDSDINKINTTI